jgi:hypothetical protein
MTLQIHPIEEGLEYLLTHFETLWPKRISTKTTENRQILVYNKVEALARFKRTLLVHQGLQVEL